MCKREEWMKCSAMLQFCAHGKVCGRLPGGDESGAGWPRMSAGKPPPDGLELVARDHTRLELRVGRNNLQGGDRSFAEHRRACRPIRAGNFPVPVPKDIDFANFPALFV